MIDSPNEGLNHLSTDGRELNRSVLLIRHYQMFNLNRPFYLAFLFFGAFSLWAGPHETLEEYIALADDSYEWSIESVEEFGEFKHIVVDLKSQQWRDSSIVDRPIWQHWIRIYVPDEPAENVAMIFIGGGKNQTKAPTEVLTDFAKLAKDSQTIVVYLGQVPNQPLMFDGNPFPIREDALVAYSWKQYLETGDHTWIVNLPMVKSVVRAMDATTELLGTKEAGEYKINEFVVSGGSKRGWTAWLTTAMDKRVIATIPIVFDALKFEDSLHNHFKSYGYWSPALADYASEGLLRKLGTDEAQDLFLITDPYEFRDRLTVPKYLVNSAGDEFFPVDSARYYFDELRGDKYLRYIPNTDHSLNQSDVNQSLATFLWLIANKKEIPSFEWSWKEKNISVSNFQGSVQEVNLYEAFNQHGRDFRLLPASDETPTPRGTTWKKTDQSDTKDDAEILFDLQWNLEDRESGWHAGFVEVVFDVGFTYPFRLTTNVKVSPDDRPFEHKDHRAENYVTIHCGSLDKDVSTSVINHLKNDVGTKYAEYHVSNDRDYYTWLPVQDMRIEGRNVGAFLESLGYQEEACLFQIEAGPKPTILVNQEDGD